MSTTRPTKAAAPSADDDAAAIIPTLLRIARAAAALRALETSGLDLLAAARVYDLRAELDAALSALSEAGL